MCDRTARIIAWLGLGSAFAAVTCSRAALAETYYVAVEGLHQASHAVIGDPRFVDADRGAYWLRAGSPAIGAGDRASADDADFWGRLTAPGAPVDLGCFSYLPALTELSARSHWHLGYAYQFTPTDGHAVPDLWTLPRESDP